MGSTQHEQMAHGLERACRVVAVTRIHLAGLDEDVGHAGAQALVYGGVKIDAVGGVVVHQTPP